MLPRPASVALLGVLRDGAPTSPPDDDLQARAADGDLDAARALGEAAQAEVGAALGRAALAREGVHVRLADSTTLTLDDAERVLAAREERGPHRALRRAIERALGGVRCFSDCRIDSAPSVAAIEPFLAGTADLATAALEALEVLGGSPIEDSDSLAWALDLPSACYELPRALALLAAGRAAAGVALPCVRVPRALAGLVVDVEQAKLGVADAGRRADRWCRTVEGGALVLAMARPATAKVRLGFGLGAVLPSALRQVGYGRAEAERVCRVASARALLLVRASAALSTHGWPDAFGHVTTRAIRPTDALRELLEPEPGGGDATSVLAALDAPAAAIALRAAWDEAFFLSARAWQEPPEPAAMAPADAWRAWLGPWL